MASQATATVRKSTVLWERTPLPSALLIRLFAHFEGGESLQRQSSVWMTSSSGKLRHSRCCQTVSGGWHTQYCDATRMYRRQSLPSLRLQQSANWWIHHPSTDSFQMPVSQSVPLRQHRNVFWKTWFLELTWVLHKSNRRRFVRQRSWDLGSPQN